MSALALLVPTLKRFVAVAGQFATTFPVTTDPDLEGVLADGFAESQMNGFFPDSDLDIMLNTVTPDLNAAEGSLVVLFAGTRMLDAEIRNRKTHTRYKAGPVESEVDYGASVLAQLLKQYEAEKLRVIALAASIGASDAFWMSDMAVARAIASYGPLPIAVPYRDPLGGLL